MSYSTSYPQTETHVVPTAFTSSLTCHFSYKMDCLHEIKYLDNESKLPTTNLTFLNPYHNYLKHLTSFKRVINTISYPSTIKVKEYIQQTFFSSYQLLATTLQQYITLAFPVQFTQEWITKEYTYLHFGALQLALTFHGRKRLPTISRITLFNTCFLNFEYVNLGIV